MRAGRNQAFITESSGRWGIRTSEGVRHLIYSQTPLATWVTVHFQPVTGSQSGQWKTLRPIASLQREPTMGIEPITYHLQGGCSAELSYVGGLLKVQD